MTVSGGKLYDYHVIDYNERITGHEDRILLKKWIFFFSFVQVLIKNYNKEFIRFFVFWSDAEYFKGTSVYCTLMYYIPAEGNASSLVTEVTEKSMHHELHFKDVYCLY